MFSYGVKGVWGGVSIRKLVNQGVSVRAISNRDIIPLKKKTKKMKKEEGAK